MFQAGGAYNPALDGSGENVTRGSGVGSFGPVVFQVSEKTLAAVRDVQRETAARVEEHQVVGAKPRLEFLSPELDQTTFKAFWSKAFGLDPKAEIKKLRELCEAGAVHLLILGGENFGKSMLTKVAERWLYSGPGGAPQVAEATLSFKEYV